MAATVADGTYTIVITFTNDDSQTADLTVTVTVNALAGACSTPTATLVTIPALQGTSDTNTANGLTRTICGVVVGDFQGSPGLNGFYLQDPAGDGDATTSDGVFVFVPSANSTWFSFDVAAGDAVQVTGRATEFQGQTEIDSVTSIAKCGTDTTIAPTTVNLPETVNGELERYEGMLVTIPQTLTVDQNYFLGRYGQVSLSAGEGRLYTPTNRYDAGSADALALADTNARRVIVLDDARSAQNPNPIPYLGADNTLRPGDTTPGLTGVLDFGAINSDTTIRDYRIQPTEAVTFTRVNARTAAPANVGGNVKVASFNVLNYFTTIDQTGAQCAPTSTRDNCWGADSDAEFTRQRDKIIAAVVAIDPDVAGLMEIENNGDTAVQNLVDGLNAATTAGKYAIIPATAAPGTDAIKVALLYQPGRVTPLGAAVNYQVSDPTYGAALFDRPPLTQFFQHIATGERFSVIVNHFKSKSSLPHQHNRPGR